jgi:hypothetical protein
LLFFGSLHWKYKTSWSPLALQQYWLHCPSRQPLSPDLH